MAPSQEAPRNFQYSASAVGVSGRITGPIAELISPQVSCVLSPHGGQTSTRLDNIRVSQLLEVGSAQAVSVGQYNEGARSWFTGIRVVLENCNILNGLLKIRQVVAALTSSYPVDAGWPLFSADATTIEDFRIAGGFSGIDFNRDLYWEPRSYNDFLKWHATRGYPEGDRILKQARFHGPIITSLVSNLKIETQEKFEIEGNAIYLPRLGRIHLAELTVEPERRALTMLRIKLDGEVKGEINLATVFLNGIGPSRQEDFQGERSEDFATDLNDEEEVEVLDELKGWMNTHPRQDEPFLFFMGRSLTPAEFFQEVEERTRFGTSFLRFLAYQSKVSDQRPRDFIRRAIDANRPE